MRIYISVTQKSKTAAERTNERPVRSSCLSCFWKKEKGKRKKEGSRGKLCSHVREEKVQSSNKKRVRLLERSLFRKVSKETLPVLSLTFHGVIHTYIHISFRLASLLSSRVRPGMLSRGYKT